MRKIFIDNIRIICILILFPYHTAMIFNNWGERFYITSTPSVIPGIFVMSVYQWWMPLLFMIAGISSGYALQKRSAKEFVMERVHKLLIPFLSGIVLIIPVQSYIANIFHQGYEGGFLESYQIFFTRFTYMTGEDGGFTPGHLWFMLYLFLVSMVMLPIMGWYNQSERKINASSITVIKLIPFFIIILLCTPFLEIGGKSFGEALICFAIGFFLLRSDEIQEKLESRRWVLLLLFAGILGVSLWMSLTARNSGLLFDIIHRIVLWFGILAWLGMGKKYLNCSGRIWNYLSGAAFPLYFLHQTVLVIVGFFTLKVIDNIVIQYFFIMLLSFVISLCLYEVCRRTKIFSLLFGFKYKK